MVPSDVIYVTFLMFMSHFAITCWSQQQCLGCLSEKFLNTDFSNLDVYEDAACERGDSLIQYWITCKSNEVCYVIDGIASYYVQGFGLTDTKLVIRGCSDLYHFSNASTCLRGTDANTFVKSLNHKLEVEDDVFLSFFDGTVCPCWDEGRCNDQQILPVVVRRPHTPPPVAQGLKCVTCVDVDFFRGLSYYDYDNPSCETGNLTDSNVFYHTCSSDGACVVIDGVVTDAGTPYRLYKRGCVHGFLDSYPRTNTLRCFSRSEAETVVPNILLSEDDYYLGYDLTFEGSVCYCTSDFCTLSGEDNTEMPGEADAATPTYIYVISSLLLVVIIIAVIIIKFLKRFK